MLIATSHNDAPVPRAPSAVFFKWLPPELFPSFTLYMLPEDLNAIINSIDDSSGAEWLEVKKQLLQDAVWANMVKQHFPHHFKKLSQEIEPGQPHDWYKCFWQIYAAQYHQLSDDSKIIFSLVKLNDFERLKTMQLSFDKVMKLKDRRRNDLIYWATVKRHQNLLEYFYQLAYLESDELQPLPREFAELIKSPLHIAAWRNMPSLCSSLVAKGANVNQEIIGGKTPLSIAASMGHTDVVTALLEASADINKGAPLYRAAAMGHADVVAILLARVADIDINKGFENSEATPLSIAAGNGHVDAVDILLAAKADPNKQQSRSAPLYDAAYGGHADVIEKLLAAGAIVNGAVDDGTTALYIAACNGHKAAVVKLLAAGASVNKAGNDSMTPLHIAAHFGHADVIAALLAAGAIIDQPGSYGKTPLIDAIENNCCMDVIDMLLSANADVNKADNLDQTPLLFAVCNGREDIVVKLLAAGADINKVSTIYPTPLHIATKMGNASLVKLLIAHGANPLLGLIAQGASPLRAFNGKKPSDIAETDEIRNLLLEAEKEFPKKLDLLVLEKRIKTLNIQHDDNKMQQAILCMTEAIKTGKAPAVLDDYRNILSADKELQIILDRWLSESPRSRVRRAWSPSTFFLASPNPQSESDVAQSTLDSSSPPKCDMGP